MTDGLSEGLTDGKNRYVYLAVHCIGLDRKRPYARHNKRFYRPYRNYFASGKEHEEWDVMALAGYAGRGEANSHGGYMYYMTREGLDWLGGMLGIHIYDDEK